ncbi:MAG: hypothetical protein ACUVSX_08325 [Aggregatilineales bacterium]
MSSVGKLYHEWAEQLSTLFLEAPRTWQGVSLVAGRHLLLIYDPVARNVVRSMGCRRLRVQID